MIILPVLITVLLVWYLFMRKTKQEQDVSTQNISSRYLDGLNYLLNEQPDKAVDVFIEMIEVDSDTVETHLALGALFRRRGEVDRAIRIHQNLIARPNLNRQQRMSSLFELGQDYMRAGVLDRAETLFLELVNMGEKKSQCLNYLIDIYQQQRDWEQAIITAQKIEAMLDSDMRHVIAHYYCELADESKDSGYLDKTTKFLKRALTTNPLCVRAHILQADLHFAQKRTKQAMQIYHMVIAKHPKYITEVLDNLKMCYQEQGKLNAFYAFLQKYLETNPNVFAANQVLSHYVDANISSERNEQLINKLKQQPSMIGVKLLIDLKCQERFDRDKEYWQLLRDMLTKIVAKKPNYLCSHCGFFSKSLYWFCPSCKHWESIEPVLESNSN